MWLLALLGRKWTLRVLWELRDQRLSFRALQARCDDISPSVLNRRLKELKTAMIIDHNGLGYGYTQLGSELGAQLLNLNDWAAKWSVEMEALR
ncbi:MAG: helix-turn-helix domain-containing protein [Gammaproteobacteria bacterium]|nr:helix-turn-helix domain-containing protein [Gammaproteobacteria bacterium]